MSNVDINFLGDVGKNDILGVKNGFRKLTELYIRQLVDEGKWFTVCHKIDNNQEDIMQIQGADGTKLGSVIDGIFEEGSYRSSIYKYLLMQFLCYIEVPTISFKSDTGVYRKTFNKMLVTANLDVMAWWLGVTVDELPDKYRARVYSIDMDDGDDLLSYVKLIEGKDGTRKITCPRDNIDVSERGTRVIPLFMLKAGVDALYSKMGDSMVKISFLKDNGQIRDMCSTVDYSKIREIYGDGEFYNESVETSYDGGFLNNKFLVRGFIRIPEVGGSKYDAPTRSMSYTRIINIEYDVEPDLSFINIDLSTVLEGFQNGVLNNPSKASEIVDMIEAFGLDRNCWKNTQEEGRKFNKKDVPSLIQWSDEGNLILSTTFIRELCLFMLSNPQWFSGFTGEPVNRYSGSGDVGIF